MIPEIRFKSFQSSETWEQKNIGMFLEERNEQAPEDPKYPLMGFLAGKGVAPKGERYDRSFLVKNDNKKYKRTELGDFIYSSNNLESGSIGLNRYGFASISPVYSIFKTDVKSHPIFLSEFIQRPKFINKMKKYRQGVVYGQWRIHERDFLKISDYFPAYPEQEMIGSFYEKLDLKINLLSKKKEALETYKKGLMQKLFSQELRFKREDGTDYPEWKSYKLKEVLIEHKKRSDGSEHVHSVSVHKGVVNQIEHLGRSFAAKDVSNYNKVLFGDVIYTKSPTGDFPYGIIKQSYVHNAIVSPLYCVTSPIDINIGYLLNWFFESNINVHNYLHPIIQKGAKNTINITNSTFLSRSLFLPSDKAERQKIKDVYSSLNDNLRTLESEISKVTEFKKGLLQQMFV